MARFATLDAVIVGNNATRPVLVNVDQITSYQQAGDIPGSGAPTKITFAGGGVVVTQTIAQVTTAITNAV